MSESRLIAPFQQSLAAIRLAVDKRTYVEERYIPMLRATYRHCRRIAILFNTNRIIVTVGSIIVPALLSIQRSDEPITAALYWVTWTVSLLVTICNGLMTMFKLDRKYYLFHASFEQLKTEGWQFVALTGAYKPAQGIADHDAHFTAFAQAVERLRMRETEEVYLKLQDSGSRVTATGPGGIPNVVDASRTPMRDDPLTQIANYIRQQLDGRQESQPPIGNGGPGSQAQASNTQTNRRPVSPNRAAQSVSV